MGMHSSRTSSLILNSEDEGMVGLWLRLRFLTPGRQVAITSCCKAAGRTLEYAASMSAAVSSQDCALPMSLAASKSTNNRSWHDGLALPLSAPWMTIAGSTVTVTP